MNDLMKAYRNLAASVARLCGHILAMLTMFGGLWNLYTGELDRALVFAVLFAGLSISLAIEETQDG